MSSYSLLAPGPVNLHPEVRRLLSEPMIHHRTPEFDQILARSLNGLKKIFQTEEPVFIHTSTGTGGMESVLVNCLSPGDEVLAVVSGKFGERWAQMAAAFGARVRTLTVPWGESVRVDEVEKNLSEHPNTRAVLCQACETSTGVAHPIRELGELISNFPQTLFLVDGITAVGAYPLPMDDWKIDGLVAGSQKAFMLPTGLSFVSLSKKAWSFLEKSTTPKFYFDLRQEKAANLRGETLFSSAVPLIRALDWVLTHVEKKGLSELFRQIHRRAEMTRLFAVELGFQLYAKIPSDSLTALAVPSSFDGQKIRSHLEEKFAITIMGGQDQAKGKIIRIGHMGFIEDEEMLRLFESLAQTLEDLRPTGMTTSLWPKEKILSLKEKIKNWQDQNS